MLLFLTWLEQNNDSKIGESKEEERKVNLYTDSNQKVNKRVKVSDSFVEKVTDDPIFKALEMLNGRLKEYFVSDNVLICLIINWAGQKFLFYLKV